MSAPGCPSARLLDRLVALELESAEEARLDQHLAGCATCAAAVESREPSLILARAPRRTLAETDWAPVMQRVRAEVAANPRERGRRGGWEAWWRAAAGAWPRLELAPAALGLAALVLVAVTLGVLSPPRPAVDVLARCDDRLDSGPSRFVLLSNPNACVTHVLVTGEEETQPTQLTMVVDESLADLF